MITVLEERMVKARKHHMCFHCFRHIAPGTVYRRTTIVDDGDLYSLKEHDDCARLWDAYMADNDLDFPDGSPPMLDDWNDSGEFRNLASAHRGQFPHAVTRMEFWQRDTAE